MPILDIVGRCCVTKSAERARLLASSHTGLQPFQGVCKALAASRRRTQRTNGGQRPESTISRVPICMSTTALTAITQAIVTQAAAAKTAAKSRQPKQFSSPLPCPSPPLQNTAQSGPADLVRGQRKPGGCPPGFLCSRCAYSPLRLPLRTTNSPMADTTRRTIQTMAMMVSPVAGELSEGTSGAAARGVSPSSRVARSSGSWNFS